MTKQLYEYVQDLERQIRRLEELQGTLSGTGKDHVEFSDTIISLRIISEGLNELECSRLCRCGSGLKLRGKRQ